MAAARSYRFVAGGYREYGFNAYSVQQRVREIDHLRPNDRIQSDGECVNLSIFGSMSGGRKN
jgi:hypothetical protein